MATQLMAKVKDGRFYLTDLSGSVKAQLDVPHINGSISLPYRSEVQDDEGKTLGTLLSYAPEQKRIQYRNGVGNATFNDGSLSTQRSRYSVGALTLEDLTQSDAKAQKDRGFERGFKLHSTEGVATLFSYARDGDRRVIVESDEDPIQLLPLIYHEFFADTFDGVDVEKPKNQSKPMVRQKAKPKGQFAQYVVDNYQPRVLEDAVEYIDIDGEKARFSAYMSSGLQPIILNGPTGNGKTVLSRRFAFENDMPFYFNNGNDTFRLSSAVGKFVPGNPTAVFSPGPLTLAAIFGGVYVLEEMAAIPQDELTGLNIFLEEGELEVITQFGPEIIHADPRFRFVATGNFHKNYTTNKLNDATLQRFTQLRFGYPSIDHTTEIIQMRAPGIDQGQAHLIATITDEMRQAIAEYRTDLGLKGPVTVARRLVMGDETPFRELITDSIINPLTTYENHIQEQNGEMLTKLKRVLDDNNI